MRPRPWHRMISEGPAATPASPETGHLIVVRQQAGFTMSGRDG